MKSLLLLIALVLVGCHPRREPDPNERPYGMYADTLWGHIYITTQGGRGVTSTIHAEHCKCKEWK